MEPPQIEQYKRVAKIRFQQFLDRSAPHIHQRWAGWGVALFLYLFRVFYIEGFYIVTYGLGIYNLNLLIGFLTPRNDMDADGPQLPTRTDQEFRPFIRILPEFKFWYFSIRSIVIGLVMTFFPFFDIPVFWPILLIYWIMLFGFTMHRQIRHMIKYRYLPFDIGKKKYVKGGEKDGKQKAKREF